MGDDILMVAQAVLAGAERVGFATFVPRLPAEVVGDAEMHAIFYENLSWRRGGRCWGTCCAAGSRAASCAGTSTSSSRSTC